MVLVFSYNVKFRFFLFTDYPMGYAAAPRVAFIVYGIQTFLLL